jgi:hypothetical protein
MWDLWWDKVVLGRFSPSFSVSPAIVVHSTNYSTITLIHHPGKMYNRSICGHSTRAYTNLGDLQRNLMGFKSHPTKKKVKLSLCLSNYALCHAGIWGSECTDPHFLDLGTSWSWVVSFTPRLLYPRERAPSTLRYEVGWTPEQVWTTWRRENSWSYRDLNSDPSVVQPVASRYTDCTIPASGYKILKKELK